MYGYIVISYEKLKSTFKDITIVSSMYGYVVMNYANWVLKNLGFSIIVKLLKKDLRPCYLDPTRKYDIFGILHNMLVSCLTGISHFTGIDFGKSISFA